jgi:hypothetical protein
MFGLAFLTAIKLGSLSNVSDFIGTRLCLAINSGAATQKFDVQSVKNQPDGVGPFCQDRAYLKPLFKNTSLFMLGNSA